jgi:TetR/AcrR family transcriptional repressor of nem operon
MKMKSAPAGAGARTADRVLDVAERLVQTKGFNWFSYADVSTEVGITKASLHYHFATKADLGRSLIERYTERFLAALAAIDTDGGGATRRLERYVSLYVDVLRSERMCLCGMLAAEFETLPKRMQRALRAFFDANEAWLVGVLDNGRVAREVEFEGSARDAARLVTGALEGAMLLARSYGDVGRLEIAGARVVAELATSKRTGRSAARAGARGARTERRRAR